MLQALKYKQPLLLSLTLLALLTKFPTALKSNKNKNNKTTVKTLQPVLMLQALKYKQPLPSLLTR
jgi:hypothetical protein